MKYLIVVLVTMSLGACSVLKKEEINPWLNSLDGTPAVNVSGIWWSGSAFAGGWGEGRFIQTGNRVSGTLGFYNVDGAVAGTDVYLVLFTRIKIYYTVHLHQSGDGNYVGRAVYGAIVDKKGSEGAASYQVVLKKTSNTMAP